MSIRVFLSVVALVSLAIHLGLGIVLQKADKLRNQGIITVQKFYNPANAGIEDFKLGQVANFSLGFQGACLGFREGAVNCSSLHDALDTARNLVDGPDLGPLAEAIDVMKGLIFDDLIISDLFLASSTAILYVIILWMRRLLGFWAKVLLFLGMCVPLFVAIFMVTTIGMMKTVLSGWGLDVQFGDSALYSGLFLGTTIVLNMLGAGLFF
ncbi:hypothetical protein CaCOL14_000341 [Colletotrichum acutatum]